MDKLNNLREQIDNIDEQIVRLLCERLAIVENIAEYKKLTGLRFCKNRGKPKFCQKSPLM